MVLRCVKCGSIVSSELPDSAKVMAWVECHKCVNAEVFSDRVVFQQLTMNGIKLKLFEFFMKCRFKDLDMEKLRHMMNGSLDAAVKSKFTKDGYLEKLKSESDKLSMLELQNKLNEVPYENV